MMATHQGGIGQHLERNTRTQGDDLDTIHNFPESLTEDVTEETSKDINRETHNLEHGECENHARL